MKGFSISCMNRTHYETDRGKSPYSIIEVSWKYMDAKLKLSTRMERPLDGKPSLNESLFSLLDSHVELKVADGKVSMKFKSTILQNPPYRLEMTIDQERTVSLKLSLEGVRSQ